MKQGLWAWILLVAAMSASAGMAQPRASERLAATRAAFYTATFGRGPSYMMCRSAHVATGDLQALRLAFSNFKVGNAPQEFGTESSRTVRASIEYPSGAKPVRITFSGGPAGGDGTTGAIPAAAGTVTSPGALVFSDMVALPRPIPKGATFWVRSYQVGATLYFTGGRDTKAGDVSNLGASSAAVADETGSGRAFPHTIGADAYCPPAAIIAETDSVAVLAVGDSISAGVGDSDQTDKRNGALLRTLPMPLAFLNLAGPGARAEASTGAGWRESAPNRALLFPYATTVLYELGFNDLSAGLRADATIARAQTYAANHFANAHRKFITTVGPHSASTDNWSTVANQTPRATAERAAYNARVRAGVKGFDGAFDIAAAWENTAGSGVWVVPARYRTVTDAEIGAKSNLLTSKSADFTPGDVGYGLAVIGAGNAGGTLTAYIVSVSSPTTAVISFRALTGVRGATARVGTATLDGAHPVPAMHALGSRAVDATQFR